MLQSPQQIVLGRNRDPSLINGPRTMVDLTHLHGLIQRSTRQVQVSNDLSLLSVLIVVYNFVVVVG